MSKDKGKQKVNEEIEAEADDWCFVCKDGGKLLLCDHRGCGKVYHPTCVGKRNSVLKSEGHWTCPRHSCAECGGPPQFFCLACPDSVCRLCVNAYEFVPVKLNKGLCKECFKLALLAEMDAEVDSEGDKLDFQDPDSSDFLFKDYLLVIMEREELKFDDLRRAQSESKKYDSGLDYDKVKDKDAIITISDVDRDSDSASDDSFGKRKKSQKKPGQKNKICDIFKAHFADTLELSIVDEKENDSGIPLANEDGQITSEYKRKRTSSSVKVPLEENVEYAVHKSCYASIVAQNMKLVYLRRSLVEELSTQPDNFKEKVVGSFVRVKGMPGNCLGTASFQLLQVTGIKKTSNADDNQGILLEVSCMPVDIPIDMLDDDDISEEECADLQQRMKDGLLRKPTVVELELKAKSLHEDITKNWIQRELVRLQGKIDFAHEKGRRYMLERFLDEREMLKKSSEQQRLLQKLPRVIAEEIEFDATSGNSLGRNCSTG
ncbi:hypothetical protein HRI_003092700 [Hibiscus trionum]|uniref:Plus3 domain-containing protein n=1 Tax=Hibiscus trionum TaxID=183268 RepID=A0A9W7MBG6_HIBTR|nr:hypothetical protein HRI_003092700 [Hibiscus trionum]